MKRYLKGFSSGATGSITIKADGSTLLSKAARLWQ